MRASFLLLSVTLLAGCSKPDATPAADSTAMAGEPAAGIALADAAGTWTMQLAPEDQDTTILMYTMIASADTAGWSVVFEGRDPVPMRIIQVAGDSIVAEAGPYQSALRSGVPVRINVVTRLRDNRLQSRILARYETTAGDSVVRLRAEGQRATP